MQLVAKAVGVMNVRFDTTGAVARCGSRTTLATDPALKVTTPDATAAAVLARYTGQANAE